MTIQALRYIFIRVSLDKSRAKTLVLCQMRHEYVYIKLAIDEIVLFCNLLKLEQLLRYYTRTYNYVSFVIGSQFVKVYCLLTRVSSFKNYIILCSFTVWNRVGENTSRYHNYAFTYLLMRSIVVMALQLKSRNAAIKIIMHKYHQIH